jgi:hypothetical protein
MNHSLKCSTIAYCECSIVHRYRLQVASAIGFGFTVFGILVFVYVVTRFFVEGRSVPGFPFLASLIAIFSGAQMFALGSWVNI